MISLFCIYWHQIHKWVHRLFMFNSLFPCSHSVSSSTNKGWMLIFLANSDQNRFLYSCGHPRFFACCCLCAPVCSRRETYSLTSNATTNCQSQASPTFKNGSLQYSCVVKIVNEAETQQVVGQDLTRRAAQHWRTNLPRLKPLQG